MIKKEMKCPRCKSSVTLSEEEINKERKALIDIFLSNVDTSGSCHLWKGVKSGLGYGVITRKFIRVQAHRFSWEFYNKKEIPFGLFVLHKCDNPMCVNPDHLYVGSHKDNVADMINRNRKNSQGKITLSIEQVKEIKGLIKKGVSNKEIAKLFKTSAGAISCIKTGRNWKNI